VLTALVALASSAFSAPKDAIVKSEFIYEKAPFRSCHASTIVETPTGLVAAWFGGSDEGNKDVSIWLARHGDGKWLPPVEVANGEAGGGRQPCWNPVLFQQPKGPLVLFYKVGPKPSSWWGEMKTSADGGQTWSQAQRLPEGMLGPIKNKPLLLDDGRLLCGSSTEHAGWKVHMEWTSDLGKNWSKTEPLLPAEFQTIQPTILRQGEKLQILCRSKQGRVLDSWSTDGGKTWSRLERTELLNPNSGIDAVNVADGSAVLVYNPTTFHRTPLSVAVSRDGVKWTEALQLENTPGEFSYPAAIAASDGLVHITYTFQRLRIKHVVLDPKKLAEKKS
jgi:predicted neuraminidase